MALPMPAFIKTLFDTFPLVQYPPLHAQPAPSTSRNARSVPPSSQPNPQNPTLFILPRHAPSLAAQLLFLRKGSRPVNVWATTLPSDDMPYLYIHGAGGTVIHGDALMQYIQAPSTSTPATQRTESNRRDDLRGSGMGVRITESILAFSSLLTVLEESYLLAAHLDSTERHLLGIWRDTMIKPSLQMKRLLHTSWESQVYAVTEACSALSTFIEAIKEENDGIMRIQAHVVAHVHVILAAQSGKCMSDLQDVVHQFSTILMLHDEWIEQYGKHLLF